MKEGKESEREREREACRGERRRVKERETA